MANKLWQKNVELNKEIEKFTVGKDRELDVFLAPYDVLGSMAHITMLESINLLTSSELEVLLKELKNIYRLAESGKFVIEDGVEDVHQLLQKLKKEGKCILLASHSATDISKACDEVYKIKEGKIYRS